jgi:hypothetical protein
MRLHAEDPFINSVGVGSMMVFGSAAWKSNPDGTVYVTAEAVAGAQPARYELPLISAGCLLLVLPLIRRAQPLESVVYAVPLIFCVLSPPGYYYSFLVLLVFLPWRGGAGRYQPDKFPRNGAPRLHHGRHLCFRVRFARSSSALLPSIHSDGPLLPRLGRVRICPTRSCREVVCRKDDSRLRLRRAELRLDSRPQLRARRRCSPARLPLSQERPEGPFAPADSAISDSGGQESMRRLLIDRHETQSHVAGRPARVSRPPRQTRSWRRRSYTRPGLRGEHDAAHVRRWRACRRQLQIDCQSRRIASCVK